MQHGKTLLGRRHVLPSIPSLLHQIQVEGTFEDGCALFCVYILHYILMISFRVFLVTVHDPVCTEDGNLDAALYGSFLPIPSLDMFPIVDPSEYARNNAPGAVIARKERITINQGRERLRMRVTNNGDRPIQVWFV